MCFQETLKEKEIKHTQNVSTKIIFKLWNWKVVWALYWGGRGWLGLKLWTYWILIQWDEKHLCTELYIKGTVCRLFLPVSTCVYCIIQALIYLELFLLYCSEAEWIPALPEAFAWFYLYVKTEIWKVRFQFCVIRKTPKYFSDLYLIFCIQQDEREWYESILFYSKRVKKISRLDPKGTLHGLKETDYYYYFLHLFYFLSIWLSQGSGWRTKATGVSWGPRVTNIRSYRRDEQKGDQVSSTTMSFGQLDWIQLTPTERVCLT